MRQSEGVFIAGETVDLCVPTSVKDYAEWAALLNSPAATPNLAVGTFPLNADTQRQYFIRAQDSGRVLFLVRAKQSHDLLGVCSLSSFDPIRRDIMTSTVVPRKDPSARLAPLEALAMLVEHAFTRFPVQRVWGGHAESVPDGFIQRRELLGFYTGGYFENSTFVGGASRGSFVSSVTRERYDVLREQRGGSLWPGSDRASALIELLAKSSALPLHRQLKDIVVAMHRASFDELVAAEETWNSTSGSRQADP